MTDHKTIDFVKYNGLGHAIHGSIWYDIEDPRPKRRFWQKKLPEAKFIKTLCHSTEWPNEGDFIRFKGSGGPCIAKVYGYEWKRDPSDMFGLTLMFDVETSDLTAKERG
jgi:hypothetical protein